MDDTVGSGNINGKPKAAKGTSHMGGEEEEETKNHKAHKHDARQAKCLLVTPSNAAIHGEYGEQKESKV